MVLRPVNEQRTEIWEGRYETRHSDPDFETVGVKGLRKRARQSKTVIVHDVPLSPPE